MDLSGAPFSPAQAVQEVLQILGKGRPPGHSLAGGGVIESQAGGVKGQPGCSAAVGNRLAVNRAIINSLAANWRPALTEMNPHLVRATRFQTTFNDGILAQIL
jgi:hypothetical protein